MSQAAQTLTLLAAGPQVEQYFGALLPPRYWLGASRAGIGSDYTLTDGLQIPQVWLCLGPACLARRVAASAA
jgi:hypothetical protein